MNSKKINYLIIDDEPLAHKVILKYAEDLPLLELKGQCYLPTEAYSYIESDEIDLIFLDINMPKLKGLDFLRTLVKAPKVIVTSAYETYALEGYELQVVDYLVKPFRFDRFLKAVNTVRDQIHKKVDVEANSIFIKVDKKYVQVYLNDIHYLESYGNYVKVWVSDQYYLTPRTLTSFEKEMNSDFLRIHKSFIVQRSYIDYVEGNLLNLTNGNRLTIGKNYRADIKKMF